MMKKYIPSFVTILLAVVIVICSSAFVLGGNKNQVRELDISQMTSEYTSFDSAKGSWSYSKDKLDEDNIALLRGPYISLPKGTYTAHITYSASQVQACQMNSDSAKDLIVSSNSRLEPYYKELDFDFELKGDVSDLEFAVIFTGGDFELSGLSVVENNNGLRRTVALADIFIIFAAAVFILRNWLREHYKEVAAAAIAALLISLPLINPDMSHGHDFNFHATRIEGIAQELLYGQFPVRLSSLWVGGYGYPVSIYYGDIFLYFPAILRIFGFSINAAYKCYILMINILTASLAMACFKGIFKDFKIASITTILYVTAAFRFVDCYVRTTAGELAALMFLPVVAFAIYRIYTDDINSKSYYRNSIILAAGMTGLILTHLITTELTCFILLITVLIMFKKTFRFNTIKCFLIAVLSTILFSASFLVPFLHYSSSVETYIQSWMKYDSGRNIQQVGASPYELIRFWGNWFGMGNTSSGRMMLTPGILLIAAVILSVVIIIMKKGNFRIYCLLGLSVFTLFLSSNLFCWDLIETLPMGESLVAIQFPWRYLGISIILLTLLAGETLSVILNGFENKKILNSISLAALTGAVAVSLIFMGHYVSEGYFSHYIDSHSLVLANLEDAEYLMTGTDQSRLVFEPSITDGEVNITSRRGTEITVSTKTDRGAKVELPVFAYPNYETSSGAKISCGDNNRISFDVPAGDNTTTVKYTAPAFYRIAEAVSVLSVLGAVYIYRKISREESV